jgi:hypothetical protein
LLSLAGGLADAIVERHLDGPPVLNGCLAAARCKKFEPVTQLIVQGPRQTVRPSLKHRSDAKPKLSIRGERKTRRVKFRAPTISRLAAASPFEHGVAAGLG